MSQRHRHGYAVDFPRDLHDLQLKTCREVHAANCAAICTASDPNPPG